jgi:hypothetical protein
MGEHGKKTYMPSKFLYSGVRFLERTDIELIYFLLYKSEHRFLGEDELADGKLKQSIRPKFMFEDLVTEAEKKVAKKQLQQKIDALLYGELALDEEKLRAVASAFFITGVEHLTFAQVRISLDAEIRRTKEGPDKFFDMVNADEELSTRSNIQKMVDAKMITFDPAKKTWYWKLKEGGTSIICKIPPNISNATEALYSHYKGNREFQDDVKAALLTKNPKAGKKTKEEVPEEVTE